MREAGAQQRLGKAQIPGDPMAAWNGIAPARSPASKTRGLAGIEHHQRRQAANRRKMGTREFAVGKREPTVARMPLVERGMPRIVNDVVAAGFEFRSHSRERSGVAGDFCEAHGLHTRQYACDAFAFGIRAWQVPGRVSDEQYTEFALFAARGVETCRH